MMHVEDSSMSDRTIKTFTAFSPFFLFLYVKYLYLHKYRHTER